MGLGEVPPDQPGRSHRQFPSDPATGSIIGRVRSRGPYWQYASSVLSRGLKVSLKILSGRGAALITQAIKRPGADAAFLLLLGVGLDQLVEELTPIEDRLNRYMFIQSVDVASIVPPEQPRKSEGGDANRDQSAAVGAEGFLHWRHWDARKNLRRDLPDGVQYFGRQR